MGSSRHKAVAEDAFYGVQRLILRRQIFTCYSSRMRVVEKKTQSTCCEPTLGKAEQPEGVENVRWKCDGYSWMDEVVSR